MAGSVELGKIVGCSPVVVNAIFAAVVATCKAGDEVRIKDIGTFSKIHKEGREHVANALKPGTFYDVAEKDVLKFKPSSSLDMSAPKAPAGRRR